MDDEPADLLMDETDGGPPADETDEAALAPPDPAAVLEGERSSAALIARMAAKDADTKTVVLVHTSPFLVLPPHLQTARKFYPLAPVVLSAAEADALLALPMDPTRPGPVFRLAEPGDEPSAAHRRLIRQDRTGRRCCGGS